MQWYVVELPEKQSNLNLPTAYYAARSGKKAPAVIDRVDEKQPNYRVVRGYQEADLRKLNPRAKVRPAHTIHKQDLAIAKHVVGIPTRVPQLQVGGGGEGVRVAVLDSGINPNHPAFKGVTITSRNFIKDDLTTYDPDNVTDVDGHGTHVASIVCGQPCFGFSFSGLWRLGGGMAPNIAELLVGKVLDDQGNGIEFFLIEGINWAISQGAQIINLSLSTQQRTSRNIENIIRRAVQAGCIVVIAAGNFGSQGNDSVYSPSNMREVVTVGACNFSAQVARWSSKAQNKPDFVAPGVNIIAAGLKAVNCLSGTSQAAPMVSGICAKLLSAGVNPQAVKDLLRRTCRALANEHPNAQGRGVVNYTRALANDAAANVMVRYELSYFARRKDEIASNLGEELHKKAEMAKYDRIETAAWILGFSILFYLIYLAFSLFNKKN